MDFSQFRVTRAVLFGILAAILCFIAVAAGQSKAWWLAVPLAFVIGGFTGDRTSDDIDSDFGSSNEDED